LLRALPGGVSLPWSDGGSYEFLMGRWSRILAQRFVGWVQLPPDAGVLDVGCGTGAVSEALAKAGAGRIVGVDPSPGYIAHVSASVGRQFPHASFEVGDAMALRFPDDRFDAAVCGLVLNFVPDAAAAVREMRRVVRPGGVVAAYVWDYAGRMELIRRFWDAAVAVDPAAAKVDEGLRFPICNPEVLQETFEEAPLLRVETTNIDQPITFGNFDDYWTPFLGGQGPSGGYAMKLSEDHRARLRERLRSDLRTNPDGSIPMVLRAWVARGAKA